MSPLSAISRELLRKLVHLLEIPILAGYSLLHFYFSPQIGVLALTGLLLILLEIEYIRIDYQTKLGFRITEFFSKFILRKRERNNAVGAIFFIISAIIAFSAFDYQIALLALLFAAFGDLAAALMGMAFGKRKIFRNKSYVGSFSGLLANIIVGMSLMPEYPHVFLPMAVTASFVETLTSKLNDNLTVPLFSGFIGQVIVFAGKIILPPLFGIM